MQEQNWLWTTPASEESRLWTGGAVLALWVLSAWSALTLWVDAVGLAGGAEGVVISVARDDRLVVSTT